MKIVYQYKKRMSINKFAEQNGFVMEIVERDNPKLSRFYAHFKNVESKDGCILSGEFGNGDTPEEAIVNYANSISGKLLVLHAGNPKKRKEIYAPILN